MKRIAITVLTAALLLVNFLSVSETAYAARPAVKPAQSADDLLRMMPDANAVVVINVAQLSVQIQALLSENAELASKFQSALNRLSSETGVTLQAIEQVAIGLSLSDTAQSMPVVLVTGSFDQDQILARLAAGSGKKWKSKRYKGQRIYQQQSQSGTLGKLGPRATISFFDDQSKIAFGSTADVKRVINARAGNQPSVIGNATLMSALHETSANASIRFAFTIPEELREYLGSLPGAPVFLRPLGSINQVAGTVDLGGNGLQANVSLITSSATDAAALVALINQGLTLAKIAIGNYPGGQLIISVLDGVSVAQAGNAVNVSVTVPADLIQKLIDEFKIRTP